MAVKKTSSPPPPEDTKDFGLGSKVIQQTQTRFLNKNGSFNVERTGQSFFHSLSPYHALLDMSWTKFYLMVVLSYFLVNVAFACAYMLCGAGALQGSVGETFAGRFFDAFFFSVQTVATIGYGKMNPSGYAANIVVAFEALAGLFGFALATGLLFARFSRPNAQIKYSDSAIIGPYRGITGFMFRIVNERRNQLIEVEATVSMSRIENHYGKETRRFHTLALERDKVTFFPLHWTIVHPINENSPLFGVTEEELRTSDAEFTILLTAIDETFSQTVHSRSSYKYGEVVFGAKFSDMFLTPENGVVRVDLRRLSEFERVENKVAA
ncbi:MAG TPA: ion channel [Bacteroidota bacterium]|nr:ion channel [Bacteroidota bacterium]